jgi:predicted metal-dependent hydrolase
LNREPLFQRGIELYRGGSFFECHEALEDLWRPMRGPHRLFLQSLIHFAVAFYHLERRNPPGAERQVCLERIRAGEMPEAPHLRTA